MKLLILFAILGAATAALDSVAMSEQWSAFKLQHQKKYTNYAEEKFRMKVFMDNVRKVAKHNQLYESGAVSYNMKLNAYSDMLHHEFISTVNRYNCTAGKQHLQSNAERFMPQADYQAPQQIDWREQGAVTAVKYQGNCGSCWSFSATGALEGAHFLKTGQLISLSEQNLMDCSTQYGNNGCEGGVTSQAFQYVKDNNGLDSEDSYPFEGQDDNCRYDPSNSGVTISSYSTIDSGNEDQLMQVVGSVGPVAVAIDSEGLMQYGGQGVYYNPQCSPDQLDHGVLVVGYGTTDQGEDYWLVKNSWGEQWGDGGYGKMARNRNNNCGIATQASYPIV